MATNEKVKWKKGVKRHWNMAEDKQQSIERIKMKEEKRKKRKEEGEADCKSKQIVISF